MGLPLSPGWVVRLGIIGPWPRTAPYPDEMDLSLLGQIGVAGLGVISTTVPLANNRVARKDLRKNIQADISILSDLPEGSRQREALLTHIDASIDRLIVDQARRRDPLGIGLALAFLGVSVPTGIWAISAGGWWLWLLVPVFFVFVLGSAGLAQDASRLRRDEKGRPVQSPAAPAMVQGLDER